MSPIDGLVLMWHIPMELSSAQSQSQLQSQTQSWFCLSELLPCAVIFLIVKLRRGFSQLSVVYVRFAINIFLITYFCDVSSFEPPLDNNTMDYGDGYTCSIQYFNKNCCLKNIDTNLIVFFPPDYLWFILNKSRLHHLIIYVTTLLSPGSECSLPSQLKL